MFTRSATHSSVGLLPVLLILSTLSPISYLGLSLLQWVFVTIETFNFDLQIILGAILELLGNRIIGIGWYKVTFVAKFGWDITIPINGVLSEGEALPIFNDRSRSDYKCLLLGPHHHRSNWIWLRWLPQMSWNQLVNIDEPYVIWYDLIFFPTYVFSLTIL